jgi:hypothetical protein
MKALGVFAVLCSSVLAFAQANVQTWHKQFTDPPRHYSIAPYWSWVERIQPDEVRRQVRTMAEQKVYGAYVFGFDGLRTPWMSKEWMDGMRAALEEGQKQGVSVGFITDYGWPQGDYRDVWNLEPPQSHVLRKNPEWMRRRLAYVDREISGPAEIVIEGLRKPFIAVAGQLDAKGAFLEDTLQVVSASIRGAEFRWQAPAGRWRAMVFQMEDRPMWRGYVDLMNRDAVAEYIRMVLDEHYKQFKPYFGSVITSVVSDHEGEYGHRIAWTPGLFDTFARMKGYRLEKYLPLLPYEGGKLTEKVRCDYLDVVSELYAVNYWGQVSDWLKERKVLLTGHEWEESLLAAAAFQGDFMRCQRMMTIPGIDALYNWADSPRHFKETASVAHFLERPFWCENQILQGQHSYISPQKMRLGTNMVGVWGATLMTPWFNYGKSTVAFPPVWDWRQPFWNSFHHYADYARRISYMNSQGHHVAPVLLYHPLVTVWANSDAMFNEKKWDFGRTGPRRDARDSDSPPAYDFYWRNSAEITEEHYSKLMDRLVESHWDFDVADDYFLGRAKMDGARIQIGPESFHAIVLPPMTTMRRSAMERIAEFARAGGLVIATGFLPTISMESGRGDPALAKLVKEVFDGGRGVFVGNDLARVVEILEARAPKDFKVLAGDASVFRYQKRAANGSNYYFIVNDSPDAQRISVNLSGAGKPEKWDADGGVRTALAGTPDKLDLKFAPWEAYYVVLGPGGAPAANEPRGAATTLVLPGDGWRFRPLVDAVEVPYARTATDPDGAGLEAGWHKRDFDDGSWRDQWLSSERFTITRWRTLGHFTARHHQGFAMQCGPEVDGGKVDLAKSYTTPDGRTLWWREYQPYPSPEEYFVTDLINAFPKSAVGDVGFAVTYIHSPAEREVDLDLAADTAKMWFNQKQVMAFHDMPGYRANRANFARRVRVPMRKGWNELLLKLEREGRLGFYLRLLNSDGSLPDDLAVNSEPVLPVTQPARGYRWYRAAIPPAAISVDAPAGAALYVNGVETKPVAGKVAVGGGTLALRVPAGRELIAPLRFAMGETVYRLGPWTRTGLANYSGRASYERAFTLSASMLNQQVWLDLGEVGVAAEVWVNGVKAGERVWKPFRFDVTKLLRSGENRLRIVVANSDANARAVANQRQLLSAIDLIGLHGPVRLLAYPR